MGTLELNFKPEDDPPKGVPATMLILEHAETYEQGLKVPIIVHSKDGEGEPIH